MSRLKILPRIYYYHSDSYANIIKFFFKDVGKRFIYRVVGSQALLFAERESLTFGLYPSKTGIRRQQSNKDTKTGKYLTAMHSMKELYETAHINQYLIENKIKTTIKSARTLFI